MIALGPALPISRRSRMGVPVGVRANLRLALESGRYDVVHGFEPGLPSLSYLALRSSHALSVATFLSVERLGYPPAAPAASGCSPASTRCSRPRPRSPRPPPIRFPGDYRLVTPGVDPELFRPGAQAEA